MPCTKDSTEQSLWPLVQWTTGLRQSLISVRSKPPPNHQTRCHPVFINKKETHISMRGGRIGLLGWITRDTPWLRIAAFASSGRLRVGKAGRLSPIHMRKFTPPFSMTSHPDWHAFVRPPPFGLSQRLSLNRIEGSDRLKDEQIAFLGKRKVLFNAMNV